MFCNFSEILKTREDSARLASKQSARDLVSAGSIQESINVENCVGNCRPLLSKKDILEILRREVWMAEDEEASFPFVNLEAGMKTVKDFIWYAAIGMKMFRQRL